MWNWTVFVQLNAQIPKPLRISSDQQGGKLSPTTADAHPSRYHAAGDVTITPYKQIVIAMGEGAKVALAVPTGSRMRQPKACTLLYPRAGVYQS